MTYETPSKEELQEEFAHTAKLYQAKTGVKPEVSKYIIACWMSERRKIDIRRYMWNILGMKRGTYENIIQILEMNGITHYKE